MAFKREWNTRCTAERLDEIFASTRSQKIPIPSRESLHPTESNLAHTSRSNDWELPVPKTIPARSVYQYSWSENVADLQAALHRHSTQVASHESVATAVWSWMLVLVCGAWLFLWFIRDFARIVALLPH